MTVEGHETPARAGDEDGRLSVRPTRRACKGQDARDPGCPAVGARHTLAPHDNGTGCRRALAAVDPAGSRRRGRRPGGGRRRRAHRLRRAGAQGAVPGRAPRHPDHRLLRLVGPPRHRSAHRGLGPRPADPVRAAGAEDDARPAALHRPRPGHQPAARLRQRRRRVRLRPARRQGGVAAHHDRGARRGGRALLGALRLPGAADDHLHRGAVRHPLLPGRDAVRRAALRHRHAPRS